MKIFFILHYCSLGADLANLINQSALKASADGKNEVTNEDIDFARDKIIMGKLLYVIIIITL